jgi:saccharopine dehydrogenase (NAD+, L-lysine-forming)
MRFFFDELHMRERRSDAGEILVNAKPPVSDDVVYVHAAVEGWKGKKLLRDEFVRAYYPQDILGQNRRAIAWTTACSVASVVELVIDKKLPQQGFLKQEDIPLQDFLRTQSGKFYIL